MLASCPSPRLLATAISIGDQRNRASSVAAALWAAQRIDPDASHSDSATERLRRSPLLRMTMLDFCRRYRHGVLARFHAATGTVRVDLGELSAEEEDLRRIINPEQQSDQ